MPNWWLKSPNCNISNWSRSLPQRLLVFRRCAQASESRAGRGELRLPGEDRPPYLRNRSRAAPARRRFFARPPQQLSKYPDLSNGRVSTDELAADINELDQGTSKVKDYVDQFIAHHERSPVAAAPIHRELNAAIELLIRLLTKYYGVLAGSDIDVVVSYLEDPLTIFRFAWIDAKG